jgi:hypothetical protein
MHDSSKIIADALVCLDPIIARLSTLEIERRRLCDSLEASIETIAAFLDLIPASLRDHKATDRAFVVLADARRALRFATRNDRP